jgi:hypothetical protein
MVEFVSDTISYIILRGRWYHIIVLNVHALTDDDNGDVKDSFYEELEHVSHKFRKYDMNILLGGFSAKVRKETFKTDNFELKFTQKKIMLMKLE